MNFKIIALPETQTEICLHRDCNEEGQEIVCIKTFVTNSAGTELMLGTQAKFNNASCAQRFVADYSEVSAKEFLQNCLKEEKIWTN
ncbi:hypothetical protein DYBT9623_03715 [Dyadobacter sp. CECT 9623]|uniref:Uncharacterized protein n=1 Tax=Dyadobacter linearis TaxID=2823330 RepID=A0ABN7RAE1_9BACT|nr:hypothetical protein [Dyadobacter sp. CECT 9623]CAG5071724.1 hypothetical protein DYBT9623_03715 [Dyadobacter sp. CECT 9623]